MPSMLNNGFDAELEDRHHEWLHLPELLLRWYLLFSPDLSSSLPDASRVMNENTSASSPFAACRKMVALELMPGQFPLRCW